MRGIKINPTEQTVMEVDVKSPNTSLKSLYDLIGCDLVELVQLDREVVLICDEEGKLKNISGAFRFYGCPELVIAGNAIILGGNGNRFKVLHENGKTSGRSWNGSNRRKFLNRTSDLRQSQVN